METGVRDKEMANLTDDIRHVVEEVLKSPDIKALINGYAPTETSVPEQSGIFQDIDSAVAASTIAQREIIALPLDTRRAIIKGMRDVVLSNNRELSIQAIAETGIGNTSIPSAHRDYR